MRKTILKTLIVVGIGIGIFSIPFFIDTEPEVIVKQHTTDKSIYFIS